MVGDAAFALFRLGGASVGRGHKRLRRPFRTVVCPLNCMSMNYQYLTNSYKSTFSNYEYNN